MLDHNMKLNISQIVPQIAKRARVSGAARITLLITALFSSNVYSQNTGTPSQIRVKVDANNYLILVAAAQTLPASNPTVFNNIRLKTDSSNQLYAVITGAITPTTISCSSSIGTVNQVLIGGNPCSWTGTPSITSLSTNATNAWLLTLTGYVNNSGSGTTTQYGRIGVSGFNTTGGLLFTGYQTAGGDYGTITFDGRAAQLDTVKPFHNFSGFLNGVGTAEIWNGRYLTACITDGTSWCTSGRNNDGSAGGQSAPMLDVWGGGRLTIGVNSGIVQGQSVRNTQTPGIVLRTIQSAKSSSASTGQQEWGPTFDTCGAAWNSVSGLSENLCVRNYLETIDAAGATSSKYHFSRSLNADSSGSFSDLFTITSAGLLTLTGTINATTAFQVNGTAITSGTTLLTSGSGMAVANVGANSCGTTTATIAGNNNLFTITVGATAGTQCRVAFTLAATTAWGMVCADDTTTVAVRTTAVDTTHVDAIGTFTAGDQITCIAHPR